MKICWFGIYTKNYPRNKILLSGLVSNGVDIIECNADWKSKNRYLSLYKKLRGFKEDYDVIYCAYPATIPVILAKIVSAKPVVMDAFYSMFDAVVCDRKEIKWYHPRALKLLLLDWLSVLAADYVITDTEEHKKYWSKWPFVKNKKIHTIYLGADNSIYFPKEIGGNNSDSFTVHFHGNGIPLQGLDKIVQAAKILQQDESIRFNLIGSIGNLPNLKNINVVGRVSPEELNIYLNKADVVLGIFGDTGKAKRVIPNKVYEGMAVKKPVITMDSPAIREIFSEEELCLIKNDSESLVKAIKKLQMDRALMEKLAENGYSEFVAHYTPAHIGAGLAEIFNKIISNMI